jgi:hypothetical protein
VHVVPPMQNMCILLYQRHNLSFPCHEVWRLAISTPKGKWIMRTLFCVSVHLTGDELAKTKTIVHRRVDMLWIVNMQIVSPIQEGVLPVNRFAPRRHAT